MWKEIFNTNFSPSPGGVFAFFGGQRPLTPLAAAYDLVIRYCVNRENEKCPYSHFVHVWPRGLPGRDIPSEFRTAVGEDAEQDGSPREGVERYLARLDFVPVGTCDGQDLLTVLSGTTRGSSVYVHRADVYRFPDVRCAPRASSRTIDGLPMSMSVAEDMASAHVERLIQGALRVAAENQSCIVLSFESSGFGDDALPESLQAEGDLATASIAMDADQMKLRTAFRYCLDHVSELTVSETLARLASVNASRLDTALCSAAVLSAKGVHGMAWNTVDPFLDEILASAMCSRVLAAAQFAFAVHREDTASTLLGRARDLDPQELELLITLHTLSEQIEGTDVARCVLDRLISRFPRDPATKAKRLLLALSDRAFKQARELAAELQEDYLVLLCDALSSDTLPVRRFLESARTMGAEDRAFRDLALEAHRRGRYGAAWRFLRRCEPSQGVVQLQCRILSHRVLRRSDLVDSFVDDLEGILLYVGMHPGDLGARFALARLLEDDLEFHSALTLLAVLMDRAATRLHDAAITNPASSECGWIRDPDVQCAPNPDSPALLFKAMGTFPRGRATFPGEGVIPDALAAQATPKLLYDWLYLLQNDEAWCDDGDYRTRMILLHAIMLLARHLGDPTTDALAARYLVMVQCLAGRPQEARNMGETALMALPISQPEHRSWRLGFGWLCLTEAFQRSHNPISELLHLVLCLLMLGDDIPSMKGAKEVLRVCSRVARDVQLFPFAMKYVQFERDIIQKHRVDVGSEYQLTQLEHSIRTIPALAVDAPAALQALLREGCAFLEEDLDDQPFPMLSSVAALLGHIRQKGDVVAADHIATFRKYLDRAPAHVRGLLLSQAEPKPTEEMLLELAKRVGDANSLRDLSFQGRPLRIAAERAVAYACETRNNSLFFLASGVLTQPMLSMSLTRLASQGVDTNAVNEWLYRYVAGSAASQEEVQDILSLTQVDLGTERSSLSTVLKQTTDEAIASLAGDESAMVLSRDGSGHLYVLPMARAGQGEIRCLSPDLWKPSRHREWSNKYPYAYGEWELPVNPLEQERPTSQDVRESLAGLQIDGWNPQGCNILAPDAGLFGFPFGLIPCPDGFIGQRCRISCVPSLSWLATVRNATPARSGQSMAWFGVPGKRDLTLDILVVKTQETLRCHGFETRRADRPDGIADASFAVAGAHGRVGRWGQFTSVTSDRRLRFTPVEFARFFEGCGCVVLFICSSGRSDEEPSAGETRSLVTELFERGVRTVIAPVWPLSPDVAAIWLAEFLAHFCDDKKVIDAAFAAARAVENRFPNPCAWAAMQLYGDGSVTQTDLAAQRQD